MQPFDPLGTTIHEERWTGRDVMRGMSEELSELDEDELEGLVDPEVEESTAPPAPVKMPVRPARPVKEKTVKVHKTRKRWRGYK
jgi:NuA3 HAT complex component NTO1